MAKIGINIAKGTLDQEEPKEFIIGIDLGTTNSLVAYIDQDSQEAIAVKDQTGSNKLVPSIVHFATDGEIIVGNTARDLLVQHPERTIYSVKRLMGKSFKDLSNYADYFGYKVIDEDQDRLVKIKVDQQFYSPIELSAYILKQLKLRVEKALEHEVSKAVITVPAYFNDAQRQATRDAGKLAGLEVLRIVNEPTAASLAYGLGLAQEEQKTIAVYDLGGGTFDISILNIDGGIFEVLSTNGDTFLGGDDFDRAIVDYWIETNNIDPQRLSSNKSLAQALRIQAEEAKKALSQKDAFETSIKDGEQALKLSIDLINFEKLIQPLVAKTIDNCKNALKDAELTTKDIDEVVLVGGSTRVPLVKKAVGDFFARKPHDRLNPDEVVALGAAVQADILAGNNKNFLLLDISPLSLGIETMGGLMDVIIPRNSKVPARAARQYTTHLDGQANMRISVFQGERDLVQDNRKLGEFHLKGIPAMPAGLAKVQISFTIDADGITTVEAKELRSGVAQQIEVRPQYGLSEEEMALMLLDSVKNAQADRDARGLQEAVVEAEQMITVTERFIQKNSDLLSKEELAGTNNLMEDLRATLSKTERDKNELQGKIEALNEFTRPFAERLMDKALGKAMKGKKLV